MPPAVRSTHDMFQRSVASACLLLTTFAAKAATVELFVFAGQSNMQGWQGDAAQYPSDPGKADAGIPFYYETPGMGSSHGVWTVLGPQTGRFKSGHFGPEVSFARAAKAKLGDIAVFKYSLGSTGLASDWKAPGQKGLYDGMAVEFRKAVATLEAKGDRVHVACFIWIQGESDAANDALAKGYESRLKLLISDFRTNVAKDEAVPFILGLDEQHEWVKKHPEVISAQKRIAASDKLVVRTSMLGLPKADATHLTPGGLVTHGKRLFAAFEQLRAKK